MGERQRRLEAKRRRLVKELEDVAAELYYAEMHISALQQKRAKLRYELDNLP